MLEIDLQCSSLLAPKPATIDMVLKQPHPPSTTTTTMRLTTHLPKVKINFTLEQAMKA
jgi:hypothetical protein